MNRYKTIDKIKNYQSVSSIERRQYEYLVDDILHKIEPLVHTNAMKRGIFISRTNTSELINIYNSLDKICDKLAMLKYLPENPEIIQYNLPILEIIRDSVKILEIPDYDSEVDLLSGIALTGSIMDLSVLTAIDIHNDGTMKSQLKYDTVHLITPAIYIELPNNKQICVPVGNRSSDTFEQTTEFLRNYNYIMDKLEMFYSKLVEQDNIIAAKFKAAKNYLIKEFGGDITDK